MQGMPFKRNKGSKKTIHATATFAFIAFAQNLNVPRISTLDADTLAASILPFILRTIRINPRDTLLETRSPNGGLEPGKPAAYPLIRDLRLSDQCPAGSRHPNRSERPIDSFCLLWELRQSRADLLIQQQ
ncbi:hypothetical protein SKAU_G00314500 [Synaphobranchus kaupii]|uniref:Uncharacterized protein n=1 Tax=Synaphobranchus kaupii TaxID=118154 RepID=A0A9Q1ESA7_SYNKA|nr:hypothetical protein SKAU_G00314500 [Synaphobranchus kaupii]